MSAAITTVEKLKSAADEAYRLYPNSCSHAVWHVLKQYTPDKKYVTANVMLAYLECDPRWIRAQVHELEKYANEGVLIIGGLAETPNGHVVVVYPGKSKMAGGYPFTHAGKVQIVGAKGPYALAMSTSMSSSWPGTMSKGDKTVWDPWGSDRKFSKVRFWRFDPLVNGSSPTC